MLVTSPSSEMMEIVQVARTGELLLADAPNSSEGSSSSADAQELAVAPAVGAEAGAVAGAVAANVVAATFLAGAVAADAHQIYARSKEKLSELPDSAPFAVHAADDGSTRGQAVPDGLRATLLGAPSL